MYERAEVCLYIGKGRCYKFQCLCCLCCNTREVELVVKQEASAEFVHVPSEIVSDGTWWLDQLVIYDFACIKVDDADSSQRLAVPLLGTENIFSSSAYDTKRTT